MTNTSSWLPVNARHKSNRQHSEHFDTRFTSWLGCSVSRKSAKVASWSHLVVRRDVGTDSVCMPICLSQVGSCLYKCSSYSLAALFQVDRNIHDVCTVHNALARYGTSSLHNMMFLRAFRKRTAYQHTTVQTKMSQSCSASLQSSIPLLALRKYFEEDKYPDCQ